MNGDTGPTGAAGSAGTDVSSNNIWTGLNTFNNTVSINPNPLINTPTIFYFNDGTLNIFDSINRIVPTMSNNTLINTSGPTWW